MNTCEIATTLVSVAAAVAAIVVWRWRDGRRQPTTQEAPEPLPPATHDINDDAQHARYLAARLRSPAVLSDPLALVDYTTQAADMLEGFARKQEGGE